MTAAHRRGVGLAGRLAVIGGLVLAVAGLWHLGAGPLAPPPSWRPLVLAGWVQQVGAVPATLALVRLLGLVAGAHVLGTTALALAGRLLHLPSLLRAAHLLSLPGTRTLVRHLAGVTLSSLSIIAPLAGTTPAGGQEPSAAVTAHDRPATAVLARTDPAPAGPGTAVLARTDPAPTRPATAVFRRLDPVPQPPPHPTPPGRAPTDPTTPTNPTDPARPAAVEPAAPARATWWTVEPGDHLWSIAQRHLAAAWARPASEREVDRYWRLVVRANPQLRDPDLIRPGQRIALPPTGTDPR